MWEIPFSYDGVFQVGNGWWRKEHNDAFYIFLIRLAKDIGLRGSQLVMGQKQMQHLVSKSPLLCGVPDEDPNCVWYSLIRCGTQGCDVILLYYPMITSCYCQRWQLHSNTFSFEGNLRASEFPRPGPLWASAVPHTHESLSSLRSTIPHRFTVSEKWLPDIFSVSLPRNAPILVLMTYKDSMYFGGTYTLLIAFSTYGFQSICLLTW